MREPMTGSAAREWRSRVCRPGVHAFQRLLPRYHVRCESNHQHHKLRWWNPDEPLVIDLPWNRIERDGMAELLLQLGDAVVGTVRVLFFAQSPDPSVPALWILGAMQPDEADGSLKNAIY